MTGVAVMSRTSAHPPLPPDEADSPGEDARPATQPTASPAASAAPSRHHRPGSQAPPIVKRSLPAPASAVRVGSSQPARTPGDVADTHLIDAKGVSVFYGQF